MEEIFLFDEREIPAVRSESVPIRGREIIQHTVKTVGKDILPCHSFEFNKRFFFFICGCSLFYKMYNIEIFQKS